jgi:hypothetical protein
MLMEGVKNHGYQIYCARRVSGIIFIRYAQNKKKMENQIIFKKFSEQ